MGVTWNAFDDGSTIGGLGSEGGVLRVDEENSDGARISLEEGGRAPWSITCGVYGWMVHTRFFEYREDATSALLEMKGALEELFRSDDPERFGKFVERFP